MLEDRIRALRVRMKQVGVDAYLVPTDDFHASEYVGPYFQCREYITGFTGSAGTAVIMQDMAGLWTDGRYFIQAKQQLKGSPVTLFQDGEPGVPTVHEFLEQNLNDGMCLGFDGRTISTAQAEELQSLLGKKNVSISCERDLIGDIWMNRPDLPCEPVKELDVKWCGESRASKLERIRSAVKKKGADLLILTTLDDIAWLLNIRGGDIPCCPVVLSYLILDDQEAVLYANKKAFPEDVKLALEKDGVRICPYDDVYDDAALIPEDKTVLLDKKLVNFRLSAAIPSNVHVLDAENPTLLPKAMKNQTEVENERMAHIKDGVALTRFIIWLKKNVGRRPVTEMSAQERLYEFRSEQENFMGNSFAPILAYGKHAAIVHYEPTNETDIPIEPRGFLLADTGGHYLDGTTDTTRTIVLGPLTEEQKQMYTAVLRGMLNLSAARFLYGTAGRNLDYLARGPLWEMRKDFKHGTGHGVGYYLNVHEGPNRFSWKGTSDGRGDAVLEEGMTTSDEPGYYAEGKYGIRIENMLVCVKDKWTSYGQFMRFEPLTMVPIDLDAVIPDQMTPDEREILNSYHRQVYLNLAPYLNDEEKAWLRDATRKI